MTELDYLLNLIHGSEEEIGTAFIDRTFFERLTFLDQIQNGDVEGIQIHFDSGDGINLTETIPENWLKTLGYIICSSITLSMKAAIDGGTNYETAYRQYIDFILKLERCRNTMDFINLNHEMKLTFASDVQKLLNSPVATYPDKIDRYLASHMKEPIVLADVAEFLHRDPSYLERQYKEARGTGIMEALRTERLEHSKILLRKTDMSILSIAEMYCFSSQSHYGSLFKRAFGCTPSEYRNKRR